MQACDSNARPSEPELSGMAAKCRIYAGFKVFEHFPSPPASLGYRETLQITRLSDRAHWKFVTVLSSQSPTALIIAADLGCTHSLFLTAALHWHKIYETICTLLIILCALLQINNHIYNNIQYGIFRKNTERVILLDRRQRKTRDAIFQAFTALLEIKSYSGITVQCPHPGAPPASPGSRPAPGGSARTGR